MYLGDNARSPYGTRSFEVVYNYTLECVKWLLKQNCPLIILACNTASAKALRTIQQNDLEKVNADARVLGVIRPTTEIIGNYSKSKSIGILATKGTVQSESYVIEISKFIPEVNVTQEACPMWVPLVENNEHTSEGADYFIKLYIDRLLSKNSEIDAILLACTHYPLLRNKIQKYLPSHIKLISQEEIVSDSLKDYLNRHPEIETKISRQEDRVFYTTDSSEEFNSKATIFFGEPVSSLHADV
jgi:glutamate racemase